MRGKFTLEINLGNEEMKNSDDVAAALRGIVNRFTLDGFNGPTTILDLNGNTVGSWEFQEEPKVEVIPMSNGRHEASEKDLRNFREYSEKLLENEGPNAGEWIRFSNGTLRRISYVWHDEEGTPESIQSSNGGSYHLGSYGISMSGSLFISVPADTLTLTDEMKLGNVWLFHNNFAGADRSVHALVSLRVWNCSVLPPRY